MHTIYNLTYDRKLATATFNGGSHSQFTASLAIAYSRLLYIFINLGVRGATAYCFLYLIQYLLNRNSPSHQF